MVVYLELVSVSKKSKLKKRKEKKSVGSLLPLTSFSSLSVPVLAVSPESLLSACISTASVPTTDVDLLRISGTRLNRPVDIVPSSVQHTLPMQNMVNPEKSPECDRGDEVSTLYKRVVD